MLSRPPCTNLNELGQHLEIDANEIEVARPFRLKEHTLRPPQLCFRMMKLGSSAKSLEPDARPYRKRGYFVSSPRSVIDRLKAAAIEFALIAILIAGFIIMAALVAVDVLDIR
jgi:hypothetical protein